MSKRHNRPRRVWKRKNGHGYVKRLRGPAVDLNVPMVPLVGPTAPPIPMWLTNLLRRPQAR